MTTQGILLGVDGGEWLAFHDAVRRHSVISGEVDLLQIPENALKLFREHEELVSRQEFCLIDPLEAEIKGFGLALRWEGTLELVAIRNVQLILNTGMEPRRDSQELGCARLAES